MTIFVDKEVKIEIPGPCGPIEALALSPLRDGPLYGKSFLAVVCHPHPLHGGTMNNKVVTTLMRCYRDLGIPALAFNFRGVGSSAGSFDHAVGEVDDLMAVVDWVGRQLPDPGRRLLLAGFSFGSSVAAQASHRVNDLAHLTLVAPPVERYPYDDRGSFPAPVCVIQGEEDELVDVDGVYRWVELLRTPVDLLRLPEASHFFHGKLQLFKQRLSEVLLARLG